MVRAIQYFPICYLFAAISSGQSVMHLKTGDVETDPAATVSEIARDDKLRERATASHEFDPAEVAHGKPAGTRPKFGVAVAPIVVVILVNLLLSLIVLPRLDLSFLSRPEWGGVSPAAVTGVWSVLTALTLAILAVIFLNRKRIPDLRATMDAGVNASGSQAIVVASSTATAVSRW